LGTRTHAHQREEPIKNGDRETHKKLENFRAEWEFFPFDYCSQPQKSGEKTHRNGKPRQMLGLIHWLLSWDLVLITVNAFDFVRCDPDDPDEDATAVAGGKKRKSFCCVFTVNARWCHGNYDGESWIVGALLLQDAAAFKHRSNGS